MSARARLLWPICFLVAVVVIAMIMLLLVAGLRLPSWSASERTQQGFAWPREGQAAISLSGGEIETSGDQRPVPIASLTKIMTAFLVLEREPLRVGDDGFMITITEADVADTELRRSRSESVVSLRSGETITEREALLALLLPSANNVAHLLAVRMAGSEARFADQMTERARRLGMEDTRYVDASGFNPRSVSSARDQTLLARTAMKIAAFAWLVRQRAVRAPGLGPLRTTNRLLAREGYLGVKTGSTTPAGGCFVFAVTRLIHGSEVLVVGAVTGQRGRDLLGAAFTATAALVDSIGTS